MPRPSSISLAILLAILASAPPLVAYAQGNTCDIANVKRIYALVDLLSRRSVEVVRLAADSTPQSDAQLKTLISVDAEFSLGAGDVGRPMGVGVAGARAMARDMKADTFRFLGFSSLPFEVADPCASRKVEVEFTDTKGSYVYPMTFTFENGRVTKAEGWLRPFTTGPLDRPTIP